MVLNRALKALQLPLQDGSDLISLGKQWQFLRAEYVEFFTQRWLFVRLLVPSQSPSPLSPLPFPSFLASPVPG